jgi:hypothetical protein
MSGSRAAAAATKTAPPRQRRPLKPTWIDASTLQNPPHAVLAHSLFSFKRSYSVAMS